jgi:hypothetical protein
MNIGIMESSFSELPGFPDQHLHFLCNNCVANLHSETASPFLTYLLQSVLTSRTVLVVHLNKDLLQKSLTTWRRLLESRESFVACSYLCDILYHRLLYVSPDPKERAARLPLSALYLCFSAHC